MTKGLLPSEHGSYVVLAASCVLGVLAQDSHSFVGTVLPLVAVIATFFAQQPLRSIVAQRRNGRMSSQPTLILCGILLLVATAAFAALLTSRPVVAVVIPPAALLSVLILGGDRRRSAMTEQSMLGFPALALAAPLLLLSSDGVPNLIAAASLWITVAGFFLGSTMAVRIRLSENDSLRDAMLFHTCFVLVALFAYVFGDIGTVPIWIIAIASTRLMFVFYNVGGYRSQPLARIGMIESSAALLMVVAATLSGV